MKKALLLTDGSVDMALSLGQWLNRQTEPLELTVVYAYALVQEANQPLKAAAHREANQKATENLNRWLDFLPQPWPDKLRTEVLLGNPELVLTIHLLLRQYDYLLIDFWQKGILSAFVACQNQITTQLHWLNLPEGSNCPVDVLESIEQALQKEPVLVMAKS
ncbi:hypothetical protein [Spirosoma sp. KNUC1025]|uniref:hypothetical protein n=1 Tax=Spirosoma sp. KNUC1025 TaxID=2894082 RepID=UPI0038635F8D|nr:hypothetical protein LN737_30095 [Spirosoma sp. KNUC1025]